jgi:hypothetical protein
MNAVIDALMRVAARKRAAVDDAFAHRFLTKPLIGHEIAEMNPTQFEFDGMSN